MSGTASFDLNDLPIFLRVATLKSVSRAARELRMPKSTVSRRLSELEKSLGVRLLGRSPSSVTLTRAGEALLARALPALSALQEATTAVVTDDGAARGKIRVSVPYDLGVARCAALVEAFMARHPDIEVELFLSDRQVDLSSEVFDAAVRVGVLHDKSIVAKKLGVIDGHVVASPGYLRRRGTPSRPSDLSHHDCIVFNSPPFGETWRLNGPGGEVAEVFVHARLTANALPVVVRAALAGVGVARLPTYALQDALVNRRLVRVLPEWSTGQRPVFVVFAATARLPERVRSFVDFAAKNGAMLT